MTGVGERPVLFISDLHLAAERPEMMALALRFLRGPAREARALYVLGDLFEYWIGDDATDTTAQQVLGALASLATSGVRVYFMHGNRDFLVGPAAAKRGQFELLPDAVTIELYGRRALLLHGDTLCTDDLAYQRYRRVIRSAPMRALARWLPLGLRHRVAQSIRAKSRRATKQKPAALMDVNGAAVVAAFEAYRVDLMIHGHTHRPAHHRVTVGERECERFVLADWYDRGSYLQASSQGFETISVD